MLQAGPITGQSRYLEFYLWQREYSTNFPFVDNGITEETLRAEMIYPQTQNESRAHSQKTPQHLSKANLLPTPRADYRKTSWERSLIKTLFLQTVFCLVYSLRQ